ncbi:MAG: hypothetical protein JEZ12_13605 [Desulfobacterium sp.]|nr:hypothetical protein [Desulfobacterium sp.]
MIFFCEDCGEKNDLEGSAFSNGKAVFKCHACGYRNAYFFCPQEKERHRKKDRILKSICCFSEVIGGFLYDTKNGVRETRMPTSLTRADIETLGRAFSHSYTSGQSAYPDILGMYIRIADKYFMIHRVQDNLWVVIVTRTPSLPDDVHKFILDLA